MGEVISYFVKVLLIQGIFFGFYWVFLKNRTNHSLNRIYLLSTVLLALVIPFIENPFPNRIEPVLESSAIENWLAEPIQTVTADGSRAEKNHFPIWQIIGGFYIVFALAYFIRSLFHLHILQKIKKQCEYVKKHWFKLFKTTHSKPFSFFSSVFIPKELFGTSSFDQILAHECVHVRQMHSLDRLLMDFLVALFWFNPFIYLYRNALIEVHEFQADAEVIDKFKDPVGYQEILFAQLQPASYSGLVSHFNFSTIKKRIVMMNKTKDTSLSRLAYLLTMPVIAVVILSFTTKKGNQSVEQITDQLEALAGPFEPKGQEVIEIPGPNQEDKYKPSILPLKAGSNFKVTSHFGKRHDPMDHSKIKDHKGIDFAVKIGTEVLSTADGIVQEVSNSKTGHGNRLVINHNDQFETVYSQLSEIKVSNGEKVSKGQVIALSGNSGRSTGPHLHYEVYQNDTPQNPVDYIKNYRFEKLKPDASIPPPPPMKGEPQPDAIIDKADLHEDGVVHEHVSVVVHESPAPDVEIELASVEEARELAEVARVRAAEAVVQAEKASAKRNEKLSDEDKAVIAEKAAVLSYKEAAIAKRISELEKEKAKLAAEASEMELHNERVRVRVEEKIATDKEKDKKKRKEKKKNKD